MAKQINIEEIFESAVDNILMKKIGTMTVMIIRRRTLKGEYLPGSSDDAGKYSTKPFVMPVGALSNSLAAKILKEDSFTSHGASVSETDFQLFRAKSSGNLWVWLKGGYKELRQMEGRQNSFVDLNWTGRMMQNLGILSSNNFESLIGFTSSEEREKASWHNVEGAGRSKRKHIFMGLTEDEKKELTDFAGAEIVKKIVAALKAAA